MGSHYAASKFIRHVIKSYCGVNTRSNGVVFVCLQRFYGGVSFLPGSAHQQWWLVWWVPWAYWQRRTIDMKNPKQHSTSFSSICTHFLRAWSRDGPWLVKIQHGFAQSIIPLQLSLLRYFCSSFSLSIEQYKFFPAMNQSISPCSTFCIMLPFNSEANN